MNTSRKSCHSFLCKLTLAALLLLGVIVTACQTTAPAASPARRVDDGKVKGFAVPAWEKGQFRTQDYVTSTKLIKELGSNYVTLHSTFYQDTVRGTKIYDVNTDGTRSSPDIEEQRLAVQVAHKAGLKVILKPHVNLRTGEGWRGEICTGMTPEEVDAWFKDYQKLIVAHARMAQEEGAEMFAVGTELTASEVHESQWRDTIAMVRAVYKGPLIYSANHGAENNIKWWDAVDCIGIDAYYKMSDKEDPTLDELVAAWKPWVDSCAALSKRVGKKVIFTEIGYTPVKGTATNPPSWELKGPTDMQAQKDCYEAFFKAVYNQPWFDGVIFWSWRIERERDAGYERDFTPEGKPAAAVVKAWFTGQAK